ncbi:MAG: NAD kinase [Cytophagaceae bacterium]|nr:NAD kinase [Cytophagaceae bacterium]MDW8455531.1 NAD kinase [Cytophagaceae bacterium]
MKVAIHGRPCKEDALAYLQSMFDYLKKCNISLQIYQPFKIFLEKKGINYFNHPCYSRKEEIFDADFMFSLGGDGTLLEAITFIERRNIPILGINLGRLGFLATTPRNEINNAIDLLLAKKFRINERSLIKLIEGEELFNDINYGLNEFAILKRDTSSMIVVHTYLNDEYLNSYWADGLLISTPTGSTGYSLSCGGPLVMPQNNLFILTPVSPHNLNVRPLIVPDNVTLSFEVESRSNSFLISLDSRSVKVPTKTKLSVKKEDFKIRLVELENYNYFQTLRDKLNWGLDLRN